MKPGRLPQNHPDEQLARAKLRERTAGTPTKPLAAPPPQRRKPPQQPPQRWGMTQ